MMTRRSVGEFLRLSQDGGFNTIGILLGHFNLRRLSSLEAINLNIHGGHLASCAGKNAIKDAIAFRRSEYE
jgi:hypothetical protein